jgi:hypothetical protein
MKFLLALSSFASSAAVLGFLGVGTVEAIVLWGFREAAVEILVGNTVATVAMLVIGVAFFWLGLRFVTVRKRLEAAFDGDT